MSDIVDLGASALNPTTNAVTASCKGAEVDGDSTDAPDFADLTLACALGVAARPAPADENGSAQGLILDDIPGQMGVVVGGFDPRTADTYKELGPGETALFATGDGYDARVLCKDQVVSIIVGNDTVFSIDRKERKASLAVAGQLVEVSRDNGILLVGDGASIQIKGGTIALRGTVILGGGTPSAPMAQYVAGSPQAAPGVFLGV